jgi:YVTN family beta-propeller protein
MKLSTTERRARSALWTLGLTLGSVAAIAAGCGDDSETADGGGGPTTAGPTTGTQTTAGPGGGDGGQGGTGGGPVYACTTTKIGETRGSAIALAPDDSALVVTNRDVGTVTIMGVHYEGGVPVLMKGPELDVGAGSEPWQAVVDGCSDRAYVVLRNARKVIAINDVSTDPTLGPEVDVGSEPTGISISPNNNRVYVANWVQGTVTVIDPADMSIAGTIDLNATLAQSGLIGDVEPRPALAHPRSVAVTNDGDDDDTDETIVVTEWFAQRIAPEGPNGADADISKQGVVYRIPYGETTASIVDLPPVTDTGFLDHNGAVTGCFPNQVGSVTTKDGYAYVTSTCASPKGPIGVFQPTVACTTNAQCGAVGGTCNVAAGTCNPNTTDVKTSTHPALSIIDLETGTATTQVLDALFDAQDVDSARMPHLPADIAFFNDFAYIAAQGTDAVFRLQIDGDQIVLAGSPANDFIDLRRDSTDTVIKSPIGVATNHGADAFGFAIAEGTREVIALAFANQKIASPAAGEFVIEASSDPPQPGSDDERRLKGKRFFNTGLGRWSLGGEGWGSCAACHIDGLTDNVTWYFARGPRQSTSLDGSFATDDPNDQRIFNWTAIFDEVADFELNTRGTSGGLGAIVDANNVRINLATQTPPQQGLQGSTEDIADPGGSSAHPHSVLEDWNEIKLYMQSIRSPRAPVDLAQADVDAGRALFTTVAQGNCVGCHSGPKWTMSTVFYPPGDGPNAATASLDPGSLSNKSWNVDLNGFPQALMPVSATELANGNARMRFGAPPGAEQLQCILRPVGTFGVGPAEVGVAEVRADMTTPAQGAADTGRGFNPPSLLGLQAGAPFFHAGNARTLEELLDDTLFASHHRSAVASVFSPDETEKRQLIAFLLSVDETTDAEPIPAKGASGGDLCFFP